MAQHAAYLAAEKELEDIFSGKNEVGQEDRQLQAAPSTPNGTMPRRRKGNPSWRGTRTGDATVPIGAPRLATATVPLRAPRLAVVPAEPVASPLLPTTKPMAAPLLGAPLLPTTKPMASPPAKAEPVALTQDELVQSLHTALDALPKDLLVANALKRAIDQLSGVPNDMSGPSAAPPPKKAASTSGCARLNRDGNPRPRGGKQWWAVRPTGQPVPPPVKMKATSKLTLLSTPKAKTPAKAPIIFMAKSVAPLPVVPKPGAAELQANESSGKFFFV
jgi:hypothetical protein